MPMTLRRLVQGDRPASLVGGTFDVGDSTWYPPYRYSSDNPNEETPNLDYEALIQQAYKSNGIVFACQTARLLPFTEARFVHQEIVDGRPGDLYGHPGLSLLENPWPNGTTGDLLARMEQDGGMAGNCYIAKVQHRGKTWLRRLRPDWVSVVTLVEGDLDAGPDDYRSQVIGYIYAPPSRNGRPAPEAQTFSTDEVAHYAPIPDPVSHWRGMSWLNPVWPEVVADKSATTHKARYFKHGTALGLAIKYDPSISPETFKQFVSEFEANHSGSENAYKTLHIGGGADPITVGADLKNVDFKQVQGAGETRIAAAAGVGSIIARLSEGMQGSSLNQGNYGAAKRQFADMTLRPLWRSACGALSQFASVPDGFRLWTDTRDVAFLAEDSKDEAEILAAHAQTIRTLVDAGFAPDLVIAAVQAGDLSRLRGAHSGLYSIQLQPPGGIQPTTESETPE